MDPFWSDPVEYSFLRSSHRYHHDRLGEALDSLSAPFPELDSCPKLNPRPPTLAGKKGRRNCNCNCNMKGPDSSLGLSHSEVAKPRKGLCQRARQVTVVGSGQDGLKRLTQLDDVVHIHGYALTCSCCSNRSIISRRMSQVTTWSSFPYFLISLVMERTIS